VKCGADRDPECRVSFETDAQGKATETCRLCQGPLRSTKAGTKVCVLCGAWAADLGADLPEAGVCKTCGKPMRLIPSTKRGSYFRRCAPCGSLEPALPSNPPALPLK
jgi:hypothetical protein